MRDRKFLGIIRDVDVCCHIQTQNFPPDMRSIRVGAGRPPPTHSLPVLKAWCYKAPKFPPFNHTYPKRLKKLVHLKTYESSNKMTTLSPCVSPFCCPKRIAPVARATASDFPMAGYMAAVALFFPVVVRPLVDYAVFFHVRWLSPDMCSSYLLISSFLKNFPSNSSNRSTKSGRSS